MSMKLSADDLLKISGAMNELKSLQVNVTEFESGMHRVLLDWNNGEPQVIGIMNVGEPKSGNNWHPHHKPGMRERSGN